MNPIFSERLIAARKMAGLSLQELTDRLSIKMTRQALHKYETGESKPNSAMLIALANALNVSVDYFYSQPKEVVELVDVDFRRFSSKLTKTMQESIEARSKDVFEKYNELENLLGINEPATLFKHDVIISTLTDAEKSAKVLRTKWNLGNDPIADVVELLEDKGYKVIEIDAPEGFDGMKATYKDKRLIVLRKTEADSDVVRKRFTALHELAHHNLKFSDNLEAKEQERLCHAFACAFLFPEENARKEFDKERFHFYERELIILKEKWGISISAIFKRALDLGIISAHTFKSFNIKYRERQYHLPDKEPGRYGSKEKPTRMLKLIFQGLAKEVLTLNEAAYFAGISGWEMRKQMNLMV